MSYTGKDNLDIMSLAKNYNQYIFDWIDESKYSTILDFGAGRGEYCNNISSEKITAVELDDSLRDYLTCTAYKDLDEVGNKKFDLIYSLNVLEHIEDDSQIINKLINLLEVNGTIKILVPARMEIYSQMDKKVGHFRRYQKTELLQLFQMNNIIIEECFYFDFLGYIASHIYKYIDNSGDINPKSLKIYDSLVFPISLIFDKLGFKRIIGKNLMLIGRKTDDQ